MHLEYRTVKRLKYLLPAILVSLTVLWGSIASTSTINELNPLELSDKYIHFVGYFIVTVAWYFGLVHYQAERPAFKSFMIATMLGICIEVIQYSFFPGRFFEILDIIANISGSIIGLLIFKKFI